MNLNNPSADFSAQPPKNRTQQKEIKTETENSSGTKLFGLNFTSHYIPEHKCFSGEAECVLFFHVRISHEIKHDEALRCLISFTAEPPAWPDQTPIPEVEFPPCLEAAQSPRQSLFQWGDRADLVSLMKILRELSLLKSTKFLVLESAREKRVDGFICFLMDLTEIYGLIWFYHSHRNYD